QCCFFVGPIKFQHPRLVCVCVYINTQISSSSSLLHRSLSSLFRKRKSTTRNRDRSGKIAAPRFPIMILFVFVVSSMILLPLSQALSPTSSPAPAPISDGTSIDQGIAYVLMLVALALTYLMH
ncbi:PREDICTED: arabinogalactan peptide 22, partial [Tarenaya hassleriana]|uniref:arabinogalactan peptide 22 n=1 Tax=Tarenaya hassleriana TaxID=28532 RepID=UPI0008FD1822